MMKKVNNKKGFTLAELLVVLAILAVLVAVAIPLFTGAISKANDTAREANVRAIRAAAVVEILTDDGSHSYGTDGPWLAKANISSSGEMTGLTISAGSSSDAIKYPSGNAVDGDYEVPISTVD